LGAAGTERWEMSGPGCDLRPSQGEPESRRIFPHVGGCPNTVEHNQPLSAALTPSPIAHFLHPEAEER